MKLQILILAFFIVLCNAAEQIKVRPCNRAYKCSLQYDPVWATDGKKCNVFQNGCILANENCQRQNRYETVLEVIPQEKCQALCNSRCPKIRKPVCGHYNDEIREFTNQCMMDYYICKSGEPYMLSNDGPCKQPITLTEAVSI